jgi:hypothetical protein
LDEIGFHYTPKHGDWVNLTEADISIMSQQCLDRRLADPARLAVEVAAWERRRM